MNAGGTHLCTQLRRPCLLRRSKYIFSGILGIATTHSKDVLKENSTRKANAGVIRATTLVSENCIYDWTIRPPVSTVSINYWYAFFLDYRPNSCVQRFEDVIAGRIWTPMDTCRLVLRSLPPLVHINDALRQSYLLIFLYTARSCVGAVNNVRLNSIRSTIRTLI